MSEVQEPSPAAQVPAPVAKKSRRFRRIWKWLWRSTVVLLIAGYLLRNVLIGPWLLDFAEPIVAEALGAEVELEGTSGSWFGTLGIQRARTLADGELTPLRSFDIEGLELKYTLWDLVQGRVEGLQSVTAERIALDLDARVKSAESEEEEEEASEAKGLPAALPYLQVDSLALRYQDERSVAQVDEASLLTNAEGQLELNLPSVDFARDGQAAPTLAVTTLLDYAAGQLRVPSLKVNEVEHVERLELDLSAITEKELSFDLAVRVLEGRVEARGDLRDAQLQSTVLAQGLVAEELEPWLDLGLRGQLDAEGEVRFPLESPELATASFRFGAQQNAWRQVELEAVTGTVVLEGGWLTSESFSAQGPGLDLQARECAFPIFASDRDTRATQGTIALRVDDVPAWVQRLEVELPPQAAALRSLEVDGSIASTASQTMVSLDRSVLQTELGPIRAQGQVTLYDLQLADQSALALRVDGSEVELSALQTWLTEQGLELPEQMPPSGVIQFALGVNGTASQPEAFVSLQVRDLETPNALPDLPPGPYQTQLSLTYAEGRLALEPLLVTGPHLELTLQAEHQVDVNFAALARGELPALDGIATAKLDLRADPHAHVEGVAHLKAELQSTLDPVGMPLASDASWSLASDALTLRDQPLAMRGLRAEGEATLEGLGPLPARIRHTLFADELRVEDYPSHEFSTELEYQQNTLQLQGHLLGALAPITWQAQAPFDLQDPSELPDGELLLSLQSETMQLEEMLEVAERFGMKVELNGEAHQATGSMQFALHGSGTWNDPSLSLTVEGDQILLLPRDPEASSLLPGAASLKSSWLINGSTVQLAQLTAQAEEFSLQAKGEWQANAPLAAALMQGQALEGELAIQGDAKVPDTAWLAALPGIRRMAGSFDAAFEVKGPQTTPEVSAQWTLAGGELRLDNPAVATFDRLDFAGNFDGSKLELLECSGELGSAPFEATGSIDLASADFPVVDVQLEGTDLLLFRREGVKLRSDTGLHLHGPLNQLRADGELTLTDGRYTKPVDFILPLLRRGQPPGNGVEGISLFSLGAPLDTMEFDVYVKPGNGFRIKTNVANGMMRPDVRLIGNGEVPYLQGEVYLDRTILTMPAHRITIEQGVIRFGEENPFVPTLDILAGFRRYGYDVTIVVEGDILEPIITMSSVPPLEAEDLLLFTTTGQPPQEAANAQEALGTVAVYLAQDWLRRFFGDLSTEEEESLFDRIEIEFGRDSTNQGAETIEGRFLLRRDNFLEHDALFLTGERDAYSDFNLGLRVRFLFP